MKINGNPDGGGASAVIEGLSVTSNGTYTAGSGVDGYSPVEVNVPAPEFVTETLSVSVNNTYYPGQGVNGFSQVIVDVPQSVTGFTEKDMTEGRITITDLNNSASYVASNAFNNNNTLRTLNLPNCKVVYNNAFVECTNLSEISLPVCENISEAAFNTTGLRKVYLPACKNISSGAFRYCLSLTEVNMPELVSAGPSTFQQCSSLVSVSIPKLHYVKNAMFYQCRLLTDVYIPEMKSIGNGAFQNCLALQSINLSNCIYIDILAFVNDNLTGRLDLPNCVYINDYAFVNNKNITEISAPYATILSGTIFGCEAASDKINLSVIDFPNAVVFSSPLHLEGVTKMNFPLYQSVFRFNMAVSDGSVFTELSFGNKVYTVPSWSTTFSDKFVNYIASNTGTIYVDATMYDKWVSANGWSDYSAYFSIQGDSTVPMLSLSDGLLYGKTEAIYNYWYSTDWRGIGVNPSDVTTVSLPECRVVFDNTFYNNARNIRSVYLPNCNYIGYSAFRQCTSLTEIDLPKCRWISAEAFTACYSLSSITLRESVVCWLDGSSAFNYIESYSVYVPASLLDEYKSALNWSNISSRIFPIE